VVIDVKTSFDLRDVVAGLDAMAGSGAVAEGLRRLRKPLRADQRDHSKKAEGPDGRWPARQQKGRRRLLGRLPSTVKITSNQSVLSAVSGVAWSAIHQEGGIANNGAKIPARPFLWISDGLLTQAAAELRDAVIGRW
jgi:phage gpG-like protein